MTGRQTAEIEMKVGLMKTYFSMGDKDFKFAGSRDKKIDKVGPGHLVNTGLLSVGLCSESSSTEYSTLHMYLIFVHVGMYFQNTQIF